MTMNNMGRSKNSICDKSMKMVANIMKLSPFSGAPLPSTKQVSSFANSVKVTTSPAIPQFHRNQRGREGKTSSKAASCVMVPIEGNGSGNGNLRVVCEERVDMEAWDFIRKVHERNRSILNEA